MNPDKPTRTGKRHKRRSILLLTILYRAVREILELPSPKEFNSAFSVEIQRPKIRVVAINLGA